MKENSVYSCIDSELGAKLHSLFQSGESEVTVRHPIEGDIIVTKSDFVAHIKNLQLIAPALSPSNRIRENKRRENLKKANQIRFRTAMIGIMPVVVDVDDDKSFGFDVNGNKLDIDGMTFIVVKDYLKGIEAYDGELGAMVDEEMKRPPVRIAKKQ